MSDAIPEWAREKFEERKRRSEMNDDTWMTEGSIFSQEDKAIMSNLSKMGDHLKELKQKVEEAEEALDAAKKEYEHWANVVLPQEMFSCGVESLSLANGGTISLKRNFYCQPNKNADDRKIMSDWLREHGGAHLIVSEAIVDPEDKDNLISAGIPFTENTSINTQRLKAFLKDGIGVSSGQQKFTIDDIPKCMHFQEVTVADISS